MLKASFPPCSLHLSGWTSLNRSLVRLWTTPGPWRSTWSTWSGAPCARWRATAWRIRQSAYVGLTRQQLDDIMQERERQRDRLEAGAAAADRSVEIAQSYVVPAFERGA